VFDTSRKDHHRGTADTEGRSCIYVPISQDGRVMDSQGYALELDDE
jgi:hypothetical protein